MNKAIGNLWNCQRRNATLLASLSHKVSAAEILEESAASIVNGILGRALFWTELRMPEFILIGGADVE